jgi:uncharacterized membrane protein
MQSLLNDAAGYVVLALQAVAVVIVAVGSTRAVFDIARTAFAAQSGAAEKRAVWLDYARWLVAALTFQLGADIVATSFVPTWDELGRLAVVAVVRTLLSYFLDREMDYAAGLGVADRTHVQAGASVRGH